MSREIKFRAWADGQMWYPDKDRCDWWFLGVEGYWSLNHGIFNDEVLCDGLESFEPVLMQYTGMNDRNGVEVYEGDIVKGIASAPDGPEKVEFTGVVKWDLEDAGFYFEADGSWPCIKPWFVESFEKIGTIHENPELIEGKE